MRNDCILTIATLVDCIDPTPHIGRERVKLALKSRIVISRGWGGDIGK